MRACAKGCGSLQREEMEAVAIFFLLLSLLAGGEGRKEDGSQYDVLGVSRDASQREIRSAYKRLARVWHPDKNRSPQAQEKILEINKAYEILSGEESRRRYDMTGEVDPARSGSQSYSTHNSHGFTFFQSGNGFFHFGGFGGAQPLREDTITKHYFKTVVLPQSRRKVWLLYFFGEFCFQCGEVSRVWDELKTEMQSNGVGMASVHSSRQYDITSHCNIDSIPAIVAVLNGRVFHYRGHFQARNIRNFVKNTLPSWVITELTAEGVDEFINDSIARNRPRIILFSPHPLPSLLYKATAFSNQQVADFGFVTTDKLRGSSLGVLQRYGVALRSKKLLVFKEYPYPTAVLEGPGVSGEGLKSVVDGPRLHLPRLTSQLALDNSCGSSGRICLILVVQGAEAYNDSITDAFRRQAVRMAATSRKERNISLAYIDLGTQRQFIDSFPRRKGRKRRCENGHGPRDVLLLWRKTGFHSSYNWFTGYCGSHADFDNLLDTARQTRLETVAKPAPNLLDEFAPGFLSRMWERITDNYYRLYDSASANFQVLSLLTMTGVMASLLCCASILGVNQLPEEGPKRRHRARKEHANHSVTSGDRSPPALTAQLYKQHIEEGHKGSVAILILIDSLAAKDKQLGIADSIVRRHKRQLFFWGTLENSSSWLVSLLERSSMSPYEVETRKRFYFAGNKPRGRMCVLALFGAMKKFAVYPQSLTASSNSGGRNISECSTTEPCGETLANGGVGEGRGGLMDTVMGSFGFEEDPTSSHGEEEEEAERGLSEEEEEEEEMERGLCMWMERLEDGSVKRYSTDSWPSFIYECPLEVCLADCLYPQRELSQQ